MKYGINKTATNKEELRATKLDKRARRRGAIMRLSGLPESTASDFPCVSLLADKHLELENHLGILEFGERLIRIHTAIGIFRVEGDSLEIRNAERSSLLIEGIIQSISYESDK